MNHVLVIAVLVILAVAFLYVSPFGKCPRCRGKGNIPRGDKAPICPRCKGLKRQQRPGSRTVHRTVRMIRAERERTRKAREGNP